MGAGAGGSFFGGAFSMGRVRPGGALDALDALADGAGSTAAGRGGELMWIGSAGGVPSFPHAA